MHARIDDLLSLRDGEPVDVPLRAHVESCSECAQAKSALETVRRRLAALPPVDAPADGWDRVTRRLGSPTLAAPRRGRAAPAIAASCAILAVLAGLLMRESSYVAPPPTSSPVASAAAAQTVREIAELRDRSRILEEVLAALPERPAVERAGTAVPIDTLQAQVQWLDHQLSVSGAAHATPDVTERLWRERVELMNTLVQLRYVEAQRIAL